MATRTRQRQCIIVGTMSPDFEVRWRPARERTGKRGRRRSLLLICAAAAAVLFITGRFAERGPEAPKQTRLSAGVSGPAAAGSLQPREAGTRERTGASARVAGVRNVLAPEPAPPRTRLSVPLRPAEKQTGPRRRTVDAAPKPGRSRAQAAAPSPKRGSSLPARPDAAAIQTEVGRRLLYQGRVSEAAQMLESVAALHPHRRETHLMLGEAYQRAGEPEKAVASYARARELRFRTVPGGQR